MLTILLPNYRTPELTRLCLRSLRKYSDFSRIRIVAIDNASGDESLEYLRSLPWITLIERSPEEIAGLRPEVMHTTALDLALKRVETPFVLSMHTDTIVHDPGWLDYLLDNITASDRIAGVGSWKLEFVPWWKRFGKAVEDGLRRLCGREVKDFQFLRSHCALYRTELLREHTRGFGNGECAGSSIQRMLTAAGYELKFLPVAELCRYMAHLNHATMILNPEIKGRKTSTAKAFRQLGDKLHAGKYLEILADDSLDR